MKKECFSNIAILGINTVILIYFDQMYTGVTTQYFVAFLTLLKVCLNTLHINMTKTKKMTLRQIEEEKDVSEFAMLPQK